ncbi:MAG TPA: hypothetical protein VIG30_19685, partial [Ktedonobacterales bacterium]
LRALAQMSAEARQAPAHLFAPRTAIKFASDGGEGGPPVPGINYKYAGIEIVAYKQVATAGGEEETRLLDAGENPRDGLYVNYLLREKPEGDVTLSFHDAGGREIRRFSSAERKTRRSLAGDLKGRTGEMGREKEEARVPAEAGLNRFNWDLRYPDAAPVEGYVSRGGTVAGPAAAPGRYEVRLQVGDVTQTEHFEIMADPRAGASAEDSRAQFELLLRIRDAITEVHQAVTRIQSVRRQLGEWERRAKDHQNAQHDELTRLADAARERLAAIEAALIQAENEEDDDTLRFPIKLNIQLAALYDVVASAEAAPTAQARAVFDVLAAQARDQEDHLRGVLAGEVAAFTTRIRDAAIPAIVPSAEM